jgi:general stress protein CsbA
LKYVFAVISGLIALLFLMAGAISLHQCDGPLALPFLLVMLFFAGMCCLVGARAVGFGLAQPSNSPAVVKDLYTRVVRPMARFGMYVMTVLAVALLLGSGNFTVGAIAIAFTAVSLVTGVVLMGIGFGRNKQELITKLTGKDQAP